MLLSLNGNEISEGFLYDIGYISHVGDGVEERLEPYSDLEKILAKINSSLTKESVDLLIIEL